jgi:hypothetical protein
MIESNPADGTAPWRSRAAWAAAALALAAAAQIALERWSGAPPPAHLFRDRILPASMWVAAVPLILRLGMRFPLRGERLARDAAVHAAALVGWLLLTNLLLRLPDAGRLGWPWVLADTREGVARYAPTAVLLWGVLAWLGRGALATPENAAEPDPTLAAGRGKPLTSAPSSLPLPGLNRVRLVPLEQIRYLEADGDHVRVHTTEGPHRVRATLSDLERTLAASRTFVRIHRSHLVNVRHVREVQPFQHGDWVAVMSDGAELRIPRTRRRALERILGKGAEAPG